MPTLAHGYFAPHNILHCRLADRDAALSGMRGWGNAGLGDLATLLGPDGYGEAFAHRLADMYPSLGRSCYGRDTTR